MKTHADPDRVGKYEKSGLLGCDNPEFEQFWPDHEPCTGVIPDKREDWMDFVKENDDRYEEEEGIPGYAAATIAVGRRAMEILADEPGPFDLFTLICRADDEVLAGGITGYQAAWIKRILQTYSIRRDEVIRLLEEQ